MKILKQLALIYSYINKNCKDDIFLFVYNNNIGPKSFFFSKKENNIYVFCVINYKNNNEIKTCNLSWIGPIKEWDDCVRESYAITGR